MTESFFILAPAKINLFLEILGKRSDGYHEIATLMVPIGLADELHFTPAEAGTHLTCDDPALATGKDNLIFKAADLLRRETGCADGAAIHLVKRIPWAAGLGGGSSDAAAALRGLNDLWKLKLLSEELRTFAARLGSDVPFFVEAKPAWCTGRGEILEPLETKPNLHLVLLCPPTGCPTAEVYRRLRVPARPVDGNRAKEALIGGATRDIAASLFNRLQEPACEINPQVAAISECLKATSAPGHLMSGSGSSLFALAESVDHAGELNAALGRMPLPAGTRRWVTAVRAV